jgi:hypothetical protein
MIHKLEALTGFWFGVTTVHPSPIFPRGAALTTNYKGQLDLAGCVVVGRECRRLSSDRIVYQGLSVFGWDAALQQYTLHQFDTLERPVVEPAYGKWCGNVLSLERTTMQTRVLFEYTIVDERHHAFRQSTANAGGAWIPVLESTFERHGQ